MPRIVVIFESMSGLKVKVKFTVPNASSPGRLVVSPPDGRHKKRRHDETNRHRHKKSKKRHAVDVESELPVEDVASEIPPPTAPPRPNYSDMQRVIDHLQKQDRQELFKDPVTDEFAPGYSTVVKHPMDFTTLRKKFTARVYQSWEALLEDMMLMFDNSMLYNPPDTIYFKQSKTLKEVAKKLVELGQKGVTNFRGKTAGVVRAHNAQVAADERAEKNAIKAAIRAQRIQMKNDKLLQKAAASGILLPSTATVPHTRNAAKWTASMASLSVDGRRPLLPEEHTRTTYHPLLNMKSVAAPWGGLISGRNADGVAFVGPPLQLLSRHGGITHAMYRASARRFAEGLSGRAKEYAAKRFGLES